MTAKTTRTAKGQNKPYFRKPNEQEVAYRQLVAKRAREVALAILEPKLQDRRAAGEETHQLELMVRAVKLMLGHYPHAGTNDSTTAVAAAKNLAYRQLKGEKPEYDLETRVANPTPEAQAFGAAEAAFAEVIQFAEREVKDNAAREQIARLLGN